MLVLPRQNNTAQFKQQKDKVSQCWRPGGLGLALRRRRLAEGSGPGGPAYKSRLRWGRARRSVCEQLWDIMMTNFAACSSRWKDRKVVCGTVEKIISNLLRQSFLLLIIAKHKQENPEYEQVSRQ